MPAAEQAASVRIIPALKRKIATMAAADSASAHGSALASTGTSNDRPKPRTGDGRPEQRVDGEPDRRLRMTPTTAAVIADSAPASALLPRSVSMIGRAEEDPEEARRERHPGREQAAERAGEQRRQRAGIAKRRHEADELQHHDQRAGRRLRHAEAVEHLARRQPVIVLDRLLRDIGQHRIGAAERHHRHLAEEHRDLAEDVVPARATTSSSATGTSHSASQIAATRSAARRFGRACVGHVVAEQAVDRRGACAPPCPPPREMPARPARAPK